MTAATNKSAPHKIATHEVVTNEVAADSIPVTRFMIHFLHIDLRSGSTLGAWREVRARRSHRRGAQDGQLCISQPKRESFGRPAFYIAFGFTATGCTDNLGEEGGESS